MYKYRVHPTIIGFDGRRVRSDVLVLGYCAAEAGRGHRTAARHSVVRTSLYGLETEVFYHRGKVAVIVQEFVAVLDAECTDNDVDGLTNRNPTLSQ